MPNYPTPHINALPSDFAKTVIMPGDPLRAKLIAEKYLKNVNTFSGVRGIYGYTGEYKNTRVSVMASGMGMPSMGIYSYELFNIFGVDNIIRTGSAGAIREDINVRDIVIGMGACTNSAYAAQYGLPGTFAPICSYSLLHACTEAADAAGIRYHVGNLLSSDTFYDDAASGTSWAKLGVAAIEMEAAALYMNAARAGKNALAVCTVSDHIVTGQSLDALQRQNSFTEMMELALDTAAALGK